MCMKQKTLCSYMCMKKKDARYMTSHGNKSGLGHLCKHSCNKTHACMDS